MNVPDHKKWRPITRDTYAILVALSEGERTLTEVQSQVLADTVGVYVSLTSIFTVLRRLEDMGLLESRYKVYRLTDKGWHAQTVETRTFDGLVREAKRRVVVSGHGRF